MRVNAREPLHRHAFLNNVDRGAAAGESFAARDRKDKSIIH